MNEYSNWYVFVIQDNYVHTLLLHKMTSSYNTYLVEYGYSSLVKSGNKEFLESLVKTICIGYVQNVHFAIAKELIEVLRWRAIKLEFVSRVFAISLLFAIAIVFFNHPNNNLGKKMFMVINK